MFKYFYIAIVIGLFNIFPPVVSDAKSEDTRRVVVIGGSLTEIFYALNAEDLLVGRDRTSTYPQIARDLPDVGYIRALSPEGVLSLNPTDIVALEGAGPHSTIETLKAAGINYIEVPESFTPQGVIDKVQYVGTAFNLEAEAERLTQEIWNTFQAMESIRSESPDRKKVLFILSLQDGKVICSGKNTAADSIIRMANGENAFTNFDGYKPVSNEAIINAAPDVILMMNRHGHNEVGNEILLKNPALRVSPAAQNEHIIRMDGLYMLGFGPRTAEAARELSNLIYEYNLIPFKMPLLDEFLSP